MVDPLAGVEQINPQPFGFLSASFAAFCRSRSLWTSWGMSTVTGYHKHRQLTLRAGRSCNSPTDLLCIRNGIVNRNALGHRIKGIMRKMVANLHSGKLFKHLRGFFIGDIGGQFADALLNVMLVKLIGQLHNFIQRVETEPAMWAVKVGAIEDKSSLERGYLLGFKSLAPQLPVTSGALSPFLFHKRGKQSLNGGFHARRQ